MRPHVEKPAGGPLPSPLLTRALDKSEEVHDKVTQAAAAELSAVNEVLKHEIADGVPLAKLESALTQNEAVELKVQEAAGLVAVNDALAEELDERHQLEHRLSKSDRTLSESRAEERKSNHSALHDAITGLPNLTLVPGALGVQHMNARL